MANTAEPERRAFVSGILESVAQTLRDTKFAIAGLRGRGHPQARALWEEQYRSGIWNYLNSASEIAHYMVIVGYVQQFCPTPTILDVGCGHGRLFQLLHRFPFKSYLGVDFSAEAIQRAQPLASGSARFERVDFEEFVPAGLYDVIIFNESIYYAPRPEELLRRYMSVLTPDGVMIVSMCHNRWQGPIWTTLESAAEVVHCTAVTSERDLTWHVRVLRPYRDTARAPGSVHHHPRHRWRV
jgi:2-polyprenyl-3-methyl-5-hydroxy-6-metoxy-1,4-benzoquinol methylase